MKKKVLIFSIVLVFMLVAIFQTNVFAATNTLDDIAEKFNNSDLVAKYGQLFGSEYSASVNENVLTVSIAKEEMGDSLDFTLDGSVLTGEGLTYETVLVAGILVDCIGQINGEYEEGELFENINLFSDRVSDYTVDDEGFEMIEGEETYTVKMDIDKAVPLIDISEFYLKPEDFDFLKKIIEDNECGNQTGRNARLAYNISIGVEEDEIWIGEVGGITESTYKSILSALEVMYGEKAVEWFQETYPDFSEGNYMYNGFSIDVDEEIDLEEHPIFTGTNVVVLRLNRQYMQYRFCRTEYIGEIIDKGNKQITLDFVKDKSYELDFFDSASSSDAAFFFKYILTPAASTLEGMPEDKTIYFNIVNEKYVLGDKDNSIIKVVIGDTGLTILPSKTDVVKTTVTTKHDDIKEAEYKEYEEIENINDFSEEIYRFLKYNVTTSITYGEKVEEEENNEEEINPTTYKTLEGEGQIVDKTKKQEFSFKFDIDYAKFQKDGKVYMDGELVDSSKYISKEGSTIISFNEEYAQDLTEGEHTLKVAVADGEATTTFKVKKSKENGTTTTNETSNPKTGDNIIVYGVLLAISLVGILGTGIINKK